MGSSYSMSYFLPFYSGTPLRTLIYQHLLLTFLYIVPIARPPISLTWDGLYMPDSSCNTAMCCCPSGPLIIRTISTSNSLSMTIGLDPGGCSRSSYSITVPIPRRNSLAFTVAAVQVVWTLNATTQQIGVISAQGRTCRCTYTMQNAG